jgi:hypothetical protein
MPLPILSLSSGFPAVGVADLRDPAGEYDRRRSGFAVGSSEETGEHSRYVESIGQRQAKARPGGQAEDRKLRACDKPAF